MTNSDISLLTANRRILVVDDNPSIQNDFRKTLAGTASSSAGIDADAAALLGTSVPTKVVVDFEIDSALQGEQALDMVRRALDAGRPYALAFVDMRMPPGWDGLTTISRIWEVDDALQIVICTAYADRSWQEIQARLTARDRWLVLKKPFDKIEVLQLAHALTQKWQLAQLAGLKVDSLERMVTARTVDLERAHRVKREFLANANHELMTPMNGVCGLLDLVMMSDMSANQRADLEQARESAGTLLSLLMRIVDFNVADAGTLRDDAEDFVPVDLLQEVVREHAPSAATKGLCLSSSADGLSRERWCAPAALIRRTLALLVDNAIKFTSAGSVLVKCTSATGGLQFTVTDTGIGMTREELDWIRIPFAQVDGGMSRRSSGMGLGLPLAHRLVRTMAGTFDLDAEAGQGTVVTFTIKALPSDFPPPSP